MNQTETETLIKEEPAVLLYFSASNCGPCEAIRARLRPLMTEKFPGIRYVELPEDTDPALLARFEAFSRPLLLVFFDGREFIRKGLNMSFAELEQELTRLYGLAFD